MSYVYNSGMGGVKCDTCRALIDAGISYNEYIETYLNKAAHMPDLCWRCVAYAKTLQKEEKSCAMCKPHKMAKEKRWKFKEEALLREFERRRLYVGYGVVEA